MKRKKHRVMLLAGLGLIALAGIWVLIQGITLKGALKKAETKLASYGAQILDLPQGQISYVDKGEGPVILVSHGISGGFDQAYDAVAGKESKYRLLAPSRFGYPGSSLPTDTSVKAQAYAFVQLLDALHIEKVYMLGTSAGGAAICFALITRVSILALSYAENKFATNVSAWQGPRNLP